MSFARQLETCEEISYQDRFSCMVTRMTAKLLFVLGMCLLLANHGWAGDWPQFLGPTRNGVYAGSDLAETWPPEGPPVLWQKKVGQGFSGPAIADHKLILFHRLENEEVIECLEAGTGNQLWRFAYPTAYEDDFGFDPGPRATPSIDGGRVYTFGSEGMLHCLDLATGKKIWSVNAKTQFQAPKGFFGIACSPLVEGDALLLNIGGGNGAGIVAFDKATGKVLWKASNDEASYSSPIAATVNGQRYDCFFTRNGLVALDPGNGKIQFQYPWRPAMNASVSSATPLVIDDLIFLSASYGTGAILLRVKDNSVEKVWSADHVLSNHYATSVHRDGFLYGFDGRQEQGCNLRCVELKTGKIRWKQEGFGAGTVTLAGNQLLIMTEKGELIRAAATPEEFKPNAHAQILPFQVRAYPALADGLFYARSKDKLVCVDLSPAKKN
ncbi:MAG: outer rane biosis protein BamB [Pedosphaera sp.]|nr:outer rane biosis protein BamB [Pedosphaera sp.]